MFLKVYQRAGNNNQLDNRKHPPNNKFVNEINKIDEIIGKISENSNSDDADINFINQYKNYWLNEIINNVNRHEICTQADYFFRRLVKQLKACKNINSRFNEDISALENHDINGYLIKNTEISDIVTSYLPLALHDMWKSTREFTIHQHRNKQNAYRNRMQFFPPNKPEYIQEDEEIIENQLEYDSEQSSCNIL